MSELRNFGRKKAIDYDDYSLAYRSEGDLDEREDCTDSHAALSALVNCTVGAPEPPVNSLT